MQIRAKSSRMIHPYERKPLGSLPSEELFLWVAIAQWDAWYQKLLAWVKKEAPLKGYGPGLFQDAIGIHINKPSWYSSGIASTSWVNQASELMIRFKEYQLANYGPQSQGESLDPNALPKGNEGDALKDLKTILILSGLGIGVFLTWPVLRQLPKVLKKAFIFCITFLLLSIFTAGIGVASIYINPGEPNQESAPMSTLHLYDVSCVQVTKNQKENTSLLLSIFTASRKPCGGGIDLDFKVENGFIVFIQKCIRCDVEMHYRKPLITQPKNKS